MLKHLRTHMRWIMGAIALAFLLSTFLMYDSGGGRRREPSLSEDGRLNDYAVAAINGRELMRSELDIMVSNYARQSNIVELSSTDIPFFYQAALDNAIFQMELSKEVDSRNLNVSEEEITAQVNIMAERFPTREAFFQAVERSGIKMEDLRRDIKRQIATEKTIESSLGIQVVSDDALLEFYDLMKGLLYRRPKGFTFDIIELSDDKVAEGLRVKIAEDIGKWAEIVSDDPNSSDIIRSSTEPLFFTESILSEDKRLSNMISLNIGEVGNVIEMSSNDFMIPIKRENREESVATFDEVSLDIRAMIQDQQQRTAVDKFRRDLLARAIVEIYDHSVFPAPVSPDVAEFINEGTKPEEAAPEQKAETPEVSPDVPPEIIEEAPPGSEGNVNESAEATVETTPIVVEPEQKVETPEVPPDVPPEIIEEAPPGSEGNVNESADVTMETTPIVVEPEQKAETPEVPPDVPPEIIEEAPPGSEVNVNESADVTMETTPIVVEPEQKVETPEVPPDVPPEIIVEV
ncbi:MAG: SurA N-terminal domain-containing protein, partial [Synergistaceae bacterium]|nr:SurA N-terminal domain-containing protein [Synergistaceae bacterium]